MRYVSYAEIASAVSDMPISLTEEELIRVCRQKLSPLKHIRLAGRRSPALWPLDDLQSWFARRYKNAPELVEEFKLRLSVPVAAVKNSKARAS